MLSKAFMASILGLCLGLWGLISGSETRLAAIRLNANEYKPPPLSGLTPQQVNLLTLGHKPIYDNFLNLWVLQVLIRDDKHDATRIEDFNKVIDSVVRHKPEIETLYMLSCFVMIDDFSRPDECQKISLAGLEALPKSWRIPMTQGYVHAFLTDEPVQAASFFLMAASRESSPVWVKRVATKLIQNQQLNPDDLKKGLQIIQEEPAAKTFFKILKEKQEK